MDQMDKAVREHYDKMREKAHESIRAKSPLERRKMTAKARYTQIVKHDSTEDAKKWLIDNFGEESALAMISKWDWFRQIDLLAQALDTLPKRL